MNDSTNESFYAQTKAHIGSKQVAQAQGFDSPYLEVALVFVTVAGFWGKVNGTEQQLAIQVETKGWVCVKNRVTPKWNPGEMETRTKPCGPIPALILTQGPIWDSGCRRQPSPSEMPFSQPANEPPEKYSRGHLGWPSSLFSRKLNERTCFKFLETRLELGPQPIRTPAKKYIYFLPGSWKTKEHPFPGK